MARVVAEGTPAVRISFSPPHRPLTQFDPTLFKELPETYALLSTANFVIHESVERVTLHGSRGPRGFAHPDSDLDLALVVGPTYISEAPNKADFFHEVLVTTLRNWQSRIEIDLAAVFDRKQCGLKCLDKRVFNPSLFPTTVDCMGIYKIRDGRA